MTAQNPYPINEEFRAQFADNKGKPGMMILPEPEPQRFVVTPSKVEEVRHVVAIVRDVLLIFVLIATIYYGIKFVYALHEFGVYLQEIQSKFNQLGN